MALRDQPYLPLYIQDIMTDEKLNECSAATHGIYIKGIMCLMHKSEHYGKIELKAKYKQNKSKEKEFATMLSKHLPYSEDEIEVALKELITEGVCYYEDNFICQKRMVKDGNLSEIRALNGSKGGKNVKNSHTRRLYNDPGYLYLIQSDSDDLLFKVGISKEPYKRLVQIKRKLGIELSLVQVFETNDMGLLEDNVLSELQSYRDGEWVSGLTKNEIISVIENKSKTKANTEYENEYENEYISDNKKGIVKGKKTKEFIPPSLEDFENYFVENGFSKELAGRAWKGYDAAKWKDSRGNQIKNWKQKCQHVWFASNNSQHKISTQPTAAKGKAESAISVHDRVNAMIEEEEKSFSND